ncbi:MAG: hypothetical protein IT334_12710 [Thermomicrobiales bacterium]|nr:hypothetical protein [Thermomicrobiales bacterium]
MPTPDLTPPRQRSIPRFAWLFAAAALLLAGIWSLPGTEAQSSNVLIVIEDASPSPTGLFPGTVCYQLARNGDEVIVTQGCLAIAAAIATPAGFDRGVQYTLSVTLHDTSCSELPDLRVGNGVIPFRIRVSCPPPDDEQTDAADATGPDDAFVAAGASPIALPIATAP